MSQARGGGSLVSFETGNVALSKAFSEHLKLFKVTVSFGSTSSLVSLPCFMSHASIPAEVRAAHPPPRPHSPPPPSPPRPLPPRPHTPQVPTPTPTFPTPCSSQVRAARGLPDDLVRISAGIEDEADLIRDLEMAMAKACEEVGVSMSGQSVPKRSSGQQHMLSPQGAPMANGKINRFAANNN